MRTISSLFSEETQVNGWKTNYKPRRPPSNPLIHTSSEDHMTTVFLLSDARVVLFMLANHLLHFAVVHHKHMTRHIFHAGSLTCTLTNLLCIYGCTFWMHVCKYCICADLQLSQSASPTTRFFPVKHFGAIKLTTRWRLSEEWHLIFSGDKNQPIFKHLTVLFTSGETVVYSQGSTLSGARQKSDIGHFAGCCFGPTFPLNQELWDLIEKLMQEDLQGDWVQWWQEIRNNRPVIGAPVDEGNEHLNLSLQHSMFLMGLSLGPCREQNHGMVFFVCLFLFLKIQLPGAATAAAPTEAAGVWGIGGGLSHPVTRVEDTGSCFLVDLDLSLTHLQPLRAHGLRGEGEETTVRARLGRGSLTLEHHRKHHKIREITWD